MGFGLIKKVYKRLYQDMYPIRYARKIGVDIADSVTFTGRVGWGTEPWLISVGEHTHFAGNVTFMTHDGGVNVVRRWKEKYKNVVNSGGSGSGITVLSVRTR